MPYKKIFEFANIPVKPLPKTSFFNRIREYTNEAKSSQAKERAKFEAKQKREFEKAVKSTKLK